MLYSGKDISAQSINLFRMLLHKIYGHKISYKISAKKLPIRKEIVYNVRYGWRRST
jgi:hypothetical protein